MTRGKTKCVKPSNLKGGQKWLYDQLLPFIRAAERQNTPSPTLWRTPAGDVLVTWRTGRVHTYRRLKPGVVFLETPPAVPHEELSIESAFEYQETTRPLPSCDGWQWHATRLTDHPPETRFTNPALGAMLDFCEENSVPFEFSEHRPGKGYRLILTLKAD